LGVALSGARDRRRRDGTERAGRRAARRARRAGMTDIAYHPTRLRALRDTFRALRAAEFPWTADTVYLNNASIGPIPERTRRVLAGSFVQFSNGYRADLDRLGAACRANGTFLVVDGIQGVANSPLDVRDTAVDILACGGQKWLLSPWGSGFVYVRKELVPALE